MILQNISNTKVKKLSAKKILKKKYYEITDYKY